MDFAKLLIPQDKANHYAYGQAVFGLSWLGAYLPPTGLTSVEAAAVSLGVVAVFAVGKEIRDFVTKLGTPDPWDAVATFLGGVLPAAVLAIAF